MVRRYDPSLCRSIRNTGQAFRALTTNDVEQWSKYPGVYDLKDWKEDLHVQGRWSVTVELNVGKRFMNGESSVNSRSPVRS